MLVLLGLVTATATAAGSSPGLDAAASSPGLGAAGGLPGLDATRPPPWLEASLRAHDARRLALDRGAMTTLGVWAAANLAVGLAGDLSGGDEPARYAYQMSWMWGAVNGVLAGVGLAGALGASPGARPYREALMEARSTETLFLVNGVLDLAYVGAGAWLWERGLRTADPRTQGYGQAVVVQGAFLLLFDGVLLLLRRDLRLGLEALPVDLVPVPRGAGLSWRF